MRRIIGLNCICLLITAFTIRVSAQVDTPSDVQSDGNYVKANIGVTKFSILGINRKQYAKCLQTENFQDPGRQLKVVTIDKTIFVDDGNGYDLKAGDGILTSTELYIYSGGTPVETGTYKQGGDYSTVLVDPVFEHAGEIGGASRIGVSCKVKWVPCNQMPTPQQQWLCNWAGWPHGEFIIYDCQVSLSFL